MCKDVELCRKENLRGRWQSFAGSVAALFFSQRYLSANFGFRFPSYARGPKSNFVNKPSSHWLQAFPKVKAVEDDEFFDVKVVGRWVRCRASGTVGMSRPGRSKDQFPQATAATRAHSGSFAHLTVRSRPRRWHLQRGHGLPPRSPV